MIVALHPCSHEHRFKVSIGQVTWTFGSAEIRQRCMCPPHYTMRLLPNLFIGHVAPIARLQGWVKAQAKAQRRSWWPFPLRPLSKRPVPVSRPSFGCVPRYLEVYRPLKVVGASIFHDWLVIVSTRAGSQHTASSAHPSKWWTSSLVIVVVTISSPFRVVIILRELS